MESKSIREWLGDLPEPYRQQAFDNTAEYGEKENYEIDTAQPCNSLSTALRSAFYFGTSNEGAMYWHDFVKTLE